MDRFRTFLEAAEYVLDREKNKEKTNEEIIRKVIDENLFSTKSDVWEDQYNSLQGTLNKAITETQKNKPVSDWRFYRTPRKRHEVTGRLVCYFGLQKWRQSESEEATDIPTPLAPILVDGNVEGITNSIAFAPVEPLPNATEVHIAQIQIGEELKESFNPSSEEDAREYVFTEIVRRRGQRKFRIDLLHAYNGKCAITGCDAEAALEAAHIRPYNGQSTNIVPNGLLLRADIHTLFDLNLIAVDPKTSKVVIATVLNGTSYQHLAEYTLRSPQTGYSYEPDLKFLQE